MARLLLTWEAGSRLGHRAAVSAAALALQRAGHEVHVFAPEGVGPHEQALGAALAWQCFPALAMQAAPDTGWESRVTTLQRLGLGHADVVDARVGAWSQIYRRVRPDAVLAQAAPFAQVAARLAGVPGVEFGIGFDVPPCTTPFVPYRNEDRFDAAQALAAEARVLQVLHDSASRLRLDAARLPAPLATTVCGDLQLVTSVPALDHYGGRAGEAPRGRHVVGPLPLLDLQDAPAPWATRRPHLLAYLRHACMDIAAFIDAVAGAGVEGAIVCPDATSALVAHAARRGVRLHAGPVSLAPLLASAQVVVCHGTGLVGEALARGVPCVMFPSHFEQFIAARRLVAAGLGLMANPAQTAHYLPVVQRAAADRGLAARAARCGREAQGPDGADAFVQCVERVLRSA